MEADKKIRVAILGSGTVGTGVYKIIQNQKDEFPHKIGSELEVAKILVRNINKQREGDVYKRQRFYNSSDKSSGINYRHIVFDSVHTALIYKKAVVPYSCILCDNSRTDRIIILIFLCNVKQFRKSFVLGLI